MIGSSVKGGAIDSTMDRVFFKKIAANTPSNGSMIRTPIQRLCRPRIPIQYRRGSEAVTSIKRIAVAGAQTG
jgi:hypothetical protein